MRLVYYPLELPVIENSTFSVLSVENSNTFSMSIRDIVEQILGFDGSWVLSDHNKEFDFKKYVEFIQNPWILDVNDRKLINGLYSTLTQKAHLNGTDQKLQEMNSQISQILGELLFDEQIVDFDSTCIELKDIFKLFDIRFNMNSTDNLTQKLEEYILLKVEYQNIKLFVLNQFIAYFTKEELNELLLFSEREEVIILMIERELAGREIPDKCRCLIVDSDLCEILIHVP